MSDVDQFYKAREFWVEGKEGRRWLIRRPTFPQFVEWQDLPASERPARFLVGWEGITQKMIGGEADEPVKFELPFSAEVLGDFPDDYVSVVNEVNERVMQRFAEQEESEKK